MAIGSHQQPGRKAIKGIRSLTDIWRGGVLGAEAQTSTGNTTSANINGTTNNGRILEGNGVSDTFGSGGDTGTIASPLTTRRRPGRNHYGRHLCSAHAIDGNRSSGKRIDRSRVVCRRRRSACATTSRKPTRDSTSSVRRRLPMTMSLSQHDRFRLRDRQLHGRGHSAATSRATCWRLQRERHRRCGRLRRRGVKDNINGPTGIPRLASEFRPDARAGEQFRGACQSRPV